MTVFLVAFSSFCKKVVVKIQNIVYDNIKIGGEKNMIGKIKK